METHSGKAELNCQAVSSLLDYKSTSARQSYYPVSASRRRFRRMYQRVKSGLGRPGEVRFLTLTSAPGTQDLFQKHFRMLIMRLKRRGLVQDYIRCPELTKGGLRHDHIVFRGTYIEQAFLSALWGEIHGSPVVDIRRVVGSPLHRHRVASYLATYLAKSPCARYSYSWGWVWKGFAKSWRVLKRVSWDIGWNYRQLLTFWEMHVKVGKRPEETLKELGYVFSYL